MIHKGDLEPHAINPTFTKRSVTSMGCFGPKVSLIGRFSHTQRHPHRHTMSGTHTTLVIAGIHNHNAIIYPLESGHFLHLAISVLYQNSVPFLFQFFPFMFAANASLSRKNSQVGITSYCNSADAGTVAWGWERKLMAGNFRRWFRRNRLL